MQKPDAVIARREAPWRSRPAYLQCRAWSLSRSDCIGARVLAYCFTAISDPPDLNFADTMADRAGANQKLASA